MPNICLSSNQIPVTSTAQSGPALGSTVMVMVLAYLTFYPAFDNWLPWLSIPGTIGDVLAVYTAPPVSVVFGLLLVSHYLPRPWVRKLRQWPVYQALLRIFKNQIAPFASAVGILLLAVEFGSHYVFNIRDSFGAFCTETRLNASRNGFVGERPVAEFTFNTSPRPPITIFASRRVSFWRPALSIELWLRSPDDETCTFFR